MAKRVSGPLLMLFSFNVATNEADHADQNDGSGDNPFTCVVPGLTPLGKMAFNLYPMGILLFLCFPICLLMFRGNQQTRANIGPAVMTCLLSLYASMTKFFIQLVNCRTIGGQRVLYSAPVIVCFEGTSWVWQLTAIMGIIGLASVPYVLFYYAKQERENNTKNRWVFVVTKPYRDECWWYTSVDMGRRLFLISLGALPVDHENRLVALTFGFLLVRTVHTRLKPFPMHI